MPKLNLGCGRVVFPLDRDKPLPYQIHLDPMPDSCYEPGWVNADKFAMPGVDEQVDLFRFPWVRSSNGSPWNEGTFAEVWAAHILEHVPHKVELFKGLPAPYVKQYCDLVERFDGFFVFLYECWRVLENGGLLHVRCPMGSSWEGLSDPTHHRQLTTSAFEYLTGQDTAASPFDYHLPMRFEYEGMPIFKFRGSMAGRLDLYTPDGLTDLVKSNPALVSEFRLILRAVK